MRYSLRGKKCFFFFLNVSQLPSTEKDFLFSILYFSPIVLPKTSSKYAYWQKKISIKKTTGLVWSGGYSFPRIDPWLVLRGAKISTEYYFFIFFNDIPN